MRHKRRLLFYLSLLASVALLSCQRAPAFKAQKGVIDLRSANGPASLDGEWEFAYGKFIAADAGDVLTDYIKIPGVWNDHPRAANSAQANKAFGFATFRLRVLLPSAWKNIAIKIPIMSSAYKLWVDDRLVAQNGKVSHEAASAVPENRPLLAPVIAPDGDGSDKSITVTVHVSNYHMHKGGMRVSLYLGPEQEMLERERRQHGIDIFVFGSVAIICLYHLFLFVLRREEKSLFWFALLCALIAIRTALTGERALSAMQPGILTWHSETRLDFLTVCLAPVILSLFIYSLYPAKIGRWFMLLCVAAGASGIAVVALFRPHIYAQLVQMLLIAYLVLGLYCLQRLVVIAISGLQGGKTFLLGFLLLFLTFVNDVLYANELINTFRAVPLGLFALILSQAILLSVKFNREFRKMQKMSRAMSRFVPTDFLRMLGRESIEDVRLGDQSEREMTILFSDLRDFTKLSETLTPAENFALINEMLKRLGPIIRENHGFIDKYIGDAIMALFPERADDAVCAAIAMQKKLSEYNAERSAAKLPALKMGIGINTGRLMLGTVGEDERIEGTVISDAVNTAARLESESKNFGAGILISQDTLFLLRDPDAYAMRMLGQITVKGKSRATAIFEIYAGDDPHSVTEKNRTKAEFERAIQNYFSGRKKAARAAFARLSRKTPRDRALRYYKGIS